jgi:hypothetical protein
MKIGKENTFSTLVLELFFQSIANCRKLKIQKSTSPSGQHIFTCIHFQLYSENFSETMATGVINGHSLLRSRNRWMRSNFPEPMSVPACFR